MSLQCIFNRFSVYVDVVSNENVALFWIQSLSVCRAITFLITELIMFSLALPPVVSVSIIEPEAPGVLLRLYKRTPGKNSFQMTERNTLLSEQQRMDLSS